VRAGLSQTFDMAFAQLLARLAALLSFAPAIIKISPAASMSYAKLPNNTVLDGEIVALYEKCRPSFDPLQGLRQCLRYNPLLRSIC
jgi:hypothetical protein